jgi:hypothetical protein
VTATVRGTIGDGFRFALGVCGAALVVVALALVGVWAAHRWLTP